MAKDVTHNPWKFDGVGQYEGFGNRNESTAPVFNRVKPFVDTIVFESGATGGNYEVRDVNNGNTLTGTINLGANAQFQVVVGKYVDGVYVQSFGADGQILIYHGQEA